MEAAASFEEAHIPLLQSSMSNGRRGPLPGRSPSFVAWAQRQFKPSGPPSGASFAEMMRNFELQRDKEFRLHVCVEHSTVKTQNSG